MLMSRLDSPTGADDDMTAFVRRAEAMKQRQRDVATEELQIVMNQRDEALARVGYNQFIEAFFLICNFPSVCL